MDYGAIHQSPKRGSDQLLEWAVDIWPYVNGNALMHGLNLREMEVSDMLDVLHYMMEEDMLHHSNIMGGDAKDKVRVNIYELLYDRPYALSELAQAEARATSMGDTYGGDASEDAAALVPLDPIKRSVITKSYIQPTDFDPTADRPFGELLDPPASHPTE